MLWMAFLLSGYLALGPIAEIGTYMDPISRIYYEKCYEVAYLSKREDEFQDFFSSLMEMRYPGVFQRILPWGKTGDNKSDGYLRSERMLFQVYAPREMTEKAAISKIKADFNGAIPFWKDYFDKWRFVHNSAQGLTPKVTTTLEDLERNNPPISVGAWGQAELRLEIFKLAENDLAVLLGPAPSNQTISDLRFSDIQKVVQSIGRMQPAPTDAIRTVPPEKLNANALSEDVKSLLTVGMQKSGLVSQYFNKYHEGSSSD